MTDKRCGTCRYWAQSVKGVYGRCLQPDAQATELLTTDLTSCSKWIPKKGPKEST